MSARRHHSDKHTLPANPTYRTIDYSDGREELWPRNTTEIVDQDGHVNFMEPIELDIPIAIRWRVALGAAVANAMNWPGNISYIYVRHAIINHRNSGSFLRFARLASRLSHV